MVALGLPMKPVLHIGPSKTASTSLQAIIPKLGRPFLIKPVWAKALCREPVAPQLMGGFREGLILSAEILGDFEVFPAPVISQRLLDVFGPSIVVFVHRDPEERLRSFHAQFLKNNPGRTDTLEAFKAWMLKGLPRGLGFFAASDIAAVQKDFHQHDFRVVDYALLKTDPQAFLRAFCEACEAEMPDVGLPHMNAS